VCSTLEKEAAPVSQEIIALIAIFAPNRRASYRLFALLWVLLLIGCGKRDGSNATIERTIVLLRSNSELWASPNESAEARCYLAPAFRGAIPLLEKDGARALPILLTATFHHGFDVPQNVTGWTYCFTLLEIRDDVRGFYVRSGDGPDLDLYPAIDKAPQVPGDAWMAVSGPLLLSEKEKARVPPVMALRAILLDAEVLKRKKLLVGLILTGGRRSAPIKTYVCDLENEERQNGKRSTMHK
jgi:hypothetical protein